MSFSKEKYYQIIFKNTENILLELDSDSFIMPHFFL